MNSDAKYIPFDCFSLCVIPVQAAARINLQIKQSQYFGFVGLKTALRLFVCKADNVLSCIFNNGHETNWSLAFGHANLESAQCFHLQGTFLE